MMRMLTFLTLTFTLGLALAPPAAADEGALRERVRERIRAMRTARLIEALDLDEAGAAKVFPVINKFDDQLDEIQKDVGEARRELRESVEAGKADAAKLNKLIDRVLAGRAKRQKLEDERILAVRKVLTPTQMAKAMLVLPEIDREIEREIRRALRERRGGRRGPGGGAPGGLDDGD